MTKFLAIGMPLVYVITAATLTPAKAVRRDDLGHLSPGATGDVSIISLDEQHVELEDVLGETVPFHQNLISQGTVQGGKFVHAAQ